jgi:hypothetical protein
MDIHQLDINSYYHEPHPKDSIFLHHTEGYYRPDWVIDSWNRNKANSTNKIRTAASLVIGGKAIAEHNNSFDGNVLQAFPPCAWAHNLSIKSKKNTFLNQKSISIELCNFGPLTESLNGSFYSKSNIRISEDQICELSEPFRGFKYFHKYSEKQLISLREVLIYLSDRFEIDLNKGLKKEIIKSQTPLPEGLSRIKLQKWLNKNGFTDHWGNKIPETGEIDKRTKEAIESIGKDPFSLNQISLNGGQGLWSHSNVRMDLFDITPQPGVIDLIKSL